MHSLLETGSSRAATESDTETGLYYYRARYYDPAPGRFVGEDPIGFWGGIDFYSYVSNNSINFEDETGLCPDDKSKKPCFAQLKYRHANWTPGKNHSFWWVQDSAGNQWIITGAPTGSMSGSLNVYVDPGKAGTHYPADNSSQPLGFNSGLSPDNCDAVDKMLKVARAWPNNTIDYWGYPGPNSNSVASFLAGVGGFNVNPPPNTTGWGYPVPVKP